MFPRSSTGREKNKIDLEKEKNGLKLPWNTFFKACRTWSSRVLKTRLLSNLIVRFKLSWNGLILKEMDNKQNKIVQKMEANQTNKRNLNYSMSSFLQAGQSFLGTQSLVSSSGVKEKWPVRVVTFLIFSRTYSFPFSFLYFIFCFVWNVFFVFLFFYLKLFYWKNIFTLKLFEFELKLCFC